MLPAPARSDAFAYMASASLCAAWLSSSAAVFIPAVTMRSLAEERRGKTLEWLVARPLSEVDVLLGKFMGNVLFVLVAFPLVLPLLLTAISGTLAATRGGGADAWTPLRVLIAYDGVASCAAYLLAEAAWED